LSISLRHARCWSAALDLLLPTQKAKREACSRILNSHAVSVPLIGISKIAVLAVAARHDRAEEKFGAGVTAVTVELTLYGKTGFYLHRVDGTKIDFSYIQATASPNSRRDVMAACRLAVEDQIDRFRDERLRADNPTCDITGMPLSIKSAQVHHAPPKMFDVLADEWAATAGGHGRIAEDIDHGQLGGRLSKRHAKSWQAYHAEHANLQLVHEYANSSVESARRKIGAT
jgi:hypothetical protein